MTVLAATPPVRFCIDRLRQSVAERSRFTDTDLVGFLNEGYRSAAVRSQCFRVAATLTIPAGTQETVLPADHSQTLRLYVSGLRYRRVTSQLAGIGVAGAYYQYEGVIGLTGTPQSEDLEILVYYAKEPADLGLDDEPLWGPEWNYLLRHYTAWRCHLVAGGAQMTSRAAYERAVYESGIVALRRQVAMEVSPIGPRIRVPQSSGMPVAR